MRMKIELSEVVLYVFKSVIIPFGRGLDGSFKLWIQTDQTDWIWLYTSNFIEETNPGGYNWQENMVFRYKCLI